ncbi:unnamed protein product [Colias eurytheme]|nr:unnamed protein product [Colias eurytheme]
MKTVVKAKLLQEKQRHDGKGDTSSTALAARKKPVKCFKCMKLGQYSRDCKSVKSATVENSSEKALLTALSACVQSNVWLIDSGGLIVALVRDRPIIEDKRTNSKNIELKKQAWEDLTAAFNSQPYVSQRNNMQLKRCWENIKTLRKKELSQEASSMRRTGGVSLMQEQILTTWLTSSVPL